MKITKTVESEGPTTNKRALKDALARTNSRRTLPALIVALLFSGMTSSFHFYDMNFHSDFAMRERSQYFFAYGITFLVLAIVFSVLYFISLRKKASSNFKIAVSYMFFVWHVAWGATTSVLMFLVDGVEYFVFYIAFTLFACLIFLVKPLMSMLSLFLISASTLVLYVILPPILNKPPLDSYTIGLVGETAFAVFILSGFISIVMYRNFVKDFNKTYTINQLNEELSWRIKIDPLTELYNRREFSSLLMEKSEEIIEEKTWLSVAIIDIDYFKQYNDTYGHLEGDKCLQSIAKTLQDSICDGVADAVVARYGGEEFTALIPHVEPEKAKEVLYKAFDDIRALAIEHSTSTVEPIVTISAGLYSVRLTSDYNIQNALKKADLLLYEAKDSGRNKILTAEDDFLS